MKNATRKINLMDTGNDVDCNNAIHWKRQENFESLVLRRRHSRRRRATYRGKKKGGDGYVWDVN